MPTSFKRRSTRFGRVSPRRAKESCLSGMCNLLTQIAERGQGNPPLGESFLCDNLPSTGIFAGLQWRLPSCHHFDPDRLRHRTGTASRSSCQAAEPCPHGPVSETRDRMRERREQTDLPRDVFYQTHVAWFCPQ